MSEKRPADFGQRRRNWLNDLGFDEDPFYLYEAEAEQAHDLLRYFFVDRPYFHTIFDDPATPRPGFLFAARGTGKTATFKMVARRCSTGTLGHRALVVPYDDFTPLLNEVERDLSRITAKHHVRAIIRTMTKILADTVPATYWDAIPEHDRPLLMSYIRDFGYPLTRGQLKSLIKADPVDVDWDALTPHEMLGELARILTQLKPLPQPQNPEAVEERRFRSIYILVDRVDESLAGPEGAADLLLPLVRDRLLLTTPNVAFKFFLPAKIAQQLKDVIDLRSDKIPTSWITWDMDTLREMVDRRLQYCSGGQIESFGELCHSSARQRTMSRLIEAARHSPRTLIRLCSELITQVAERNSPIIYPDDAGRAITEFTHRLEIEQQPAVLIAGQTSAEPAEVYTTAGPPPAPTRDGLVVDVQGGQVYVDREPLDPPLTAQEFDLLKTLYRNTPEIVEHRTLIKTIWPIDADTAADEQNLRKLISRLRRRLEPGTDGRNWRFVKSARGRGYYLLTR